MSDGHRTTPFQVFWGASDVNDNFLFADFIAKPSSQEDDAHNMQSVIDSLALDYLQVSLSHITGMAHKWWGRGWWSGVCGACWEIADSAQRHSGLPIAGLRNGHS